MATYTTNYNLIKPDYEDDADIKDLNDNFDTIDTALGSKVDKETGKGLSTNDYTDTEKSKLADIAAGAEVNEIEGIKVNNTTINPDSNKVVNITVPTTAADVSALPDTTKYAAALSLTINSSTYVMTGQLKDQNGDNLGTAQTIDLPLESVVVGGSYNSQTKKVVLTLQNGNTIEFSVADLVLGLQTELSASNKLNPAYINYDSTHRAVSDTEKSTWNGKQSALSTTQLDAVNSGIDSEKVTQIETNKNNISSITNKIDEIGIVKTISPITPSAANTYERITASKITLPEGKILRITASCIFLSSYATGIAIVRGTTKENSKILALSESETDYNALSVSTVCSFGSDQDIYVFLKTNSTGTTKVVMAYDIIAP